MARALRLRFSSKTIPAYSPMTTEQLAALKGIAERAREIVPGPLYDIPHPEYAGALHRISNKPDSSWADYGELANVVPALAGYIAAFDPTTCLELLEEVERLRGLVRHMQFPMGD